MLCSGATGDQSRPALGAPKSVRSHATKSFLQHFLQFILQFWRRLLSLMRRGKFEREMDEEMRFHLEMQIEQNL
jgi:hypothetical protein